jgi:hypothetical protein
MTADVIAWYRSRMPVLGEFVAAVALTVLKSCFTAAGS